jgi:aldehyde dehydrogenase (NAD+)
MTSLTEEMQQQINTLFEAQRLNFLKIKTASINARKDKLKKLKNAISKRENEVVDALKQDLRKPAFESCIWEIYLMYGEIDFAIKKLSDWTQSHKIPSNFLTLMNDSRVVYEPKGVSLIIGPWNFPFQLIIGPLISSIAAGNCSILKPPSMAPATSAIVAKIIKETFDENEIAVIEGDASISTELLSLPFDHIFFTGSPNVGKIVMAAAAKHLTSVTLELGGKSPVIVDSTANLKKAASKIVWGKFANAGQTCVAPDYVFVHENQQEEFVNLLNKNIEKEYVVNGSLNKEEYCKIISDGNFKRVKNLFDDAVRSGAQVKVGGKFDESDNTIYPTVLTNVSKESLIMKEEIFGPVLPVLTYKNITEVIDYVNSKEKPLALYIFSEDRKSANNIVNRTSAGGSCVNDVVIHYTNPNLPFGGVNNSGIGNAHGFYGFKAFSHERSVMYQSKWFDFNSMIYPPYTGKIKEAALKFYKKYI